jgi:hypothetical protein
MWRWIIGKRRSGPDTNRLKSADPWLRLPYAPPLRAYGPGAADEFHRYLEGPSRVVAQTPEAVATWLLGCRYAADHHLLDEHDHWLHPCTFELVRSGDCEDFALWAWRKLVQAAVDAEFVVGVNHRPDGHVGRHAWVVFRDAGDEYVFDGVQRTLELIIRPRAETGEEYVPQVGVEGSGRRFVFAGLFRSEWGRSMTLEPHIAGGGAGWRP